MGRVIAIANQKGGVGKTTTAINLSAALAALNKRVLLIDSDPQGNATTGLGINKNEVENTFYDLLMDNADFIDSKKRVDLFDTLDILPTDIQLAGAEVELIDVDNKQYILKNILNKNCVRELYDYVIIDCPPSLNILTLNALVACDEVLIPLQCEFFAMEGLSQFMHTYNLVKKKLNSSIKIDGVVFTMYDSRTNLSLQVVEEVKKFMGNKYLYSVVPRAVRVGEAPSHGLPINLYDAKCPATYAYETLAENIEEM
jgi:chromosome partitioning protein